MNAIVRPIDLPPGRRVLVISDIHGNLPLLRGLLDKVGLCKDDILIILGDIGERSPGSLETLRYVMALHRQYTVYTVMGNCDELVLNFADDAEPREWFYPRIFERWGERCTLKQMARLAGARLDSPSDYPWARQVLNDRFAAEFDFLRSLPHILVNDHYLFVHGGVPREEDLEELEAHGCMKNDDFIHQGHAFRRWVIVGHWPVTLYREDIPSAAPMVDRDSHIVSIDGGCTLKWDGQLNALILPPTPDGDFSWVSYDGLPTVTALDSQAASTNSLNLRWSEREITVLEKGEEFCRCRHIASGRVLDILTEYIYEKGGVTRCEDSTDYRLPVSPGDTLSLVRSTSRGCLCKKDGVTGWYFGRVRSAEEK